MPIYEFYCENCDVMIDFMATFQQAQNGVIVSCDKCGNLMERHWEGNSISGHLDKDGTGGGAGMGIVSKMPPIERKNK